MGVLQTPALPLGYVALGMQLEREMGLEPTTFSLARRRSTTELLPRSVSDIISKSMPIVAIQNPTTAPAHIRWEPPAPCLRPYVSALHSALLGSHVPRAVCWSTGSVNADAKACALPSR